METNADQYLEEILSKIRTWLYSIGFEKIKPPLDFYVKKQQHYTDLIILATESNESEIIISIQLFSRRFDLIESFWELYTSSATPSSVVDTIRGSDSQLYYRSNWQQHKSHMIDQIFEKVKLDYFNLILPRLNEYSNIHKLDALANGLDKTFSIGNSEKYFRKLIIAKLADNPRYDEIYQEISAMYTRVIKDEPSEEYYKNNLKVIQQLYHKLQDVNPLDNPVLI